jgi:DNA-binding transcriptional ArsR family regulator
MTLSRVEAQRHAEERGQILKLLREEYGGRLTTVRSLTGAMHLLGFPMSAATMQFSLAYLRDRGYIEVQTARQQPGYRIDRAIDVHPDAPVTARLMPDGVLLIDGHIKEDPAVIF